jgi:WD40 repeat protein
MIFAPEAKSRKKLAAFSLAVVSLLVALLLGGCSGTSASPTPAVTELPAPSTPGVLVVTTPDALQHQIDQANQLQQPPQVFPSPTPTRAPGPAPRLSGSFPALDSFPAPTGDPTSVKLLASFTGQNVNAENQAEPLRATAFSPDYHLMVIADAQDTWLVETETGKPVQTLKGGANSLAWSPDGTLLAAGGLNGIILLWRWDKPNGQFRAGPLRLAASSNAETFGDTVEVAFAADSKRLAGFTSDGNIAVYNTDTGQVQAAFSSDFAGYLSWSPDGTRLADEFLNLHNPATGLTAEPADDLGIGADSPQGVAWSPDGKLLAVSGDAFELELAEVPAKAAAGQPETSVTSIKTRVELRSAAGSLKTPTVMAHLKEGRRVAWSPNGRWVAVANVPEAGKISVWDTTGRLLQTITAEQGSLRALVWPKDGLLVSGGSDGAARFWQLEHPTN